MTSKIIYLNCNGLSYASLLGLLETYAGQFDLMVLTETWFCDHQLMTEHPMYLCSSPLLVQPVNTRPSDGIFCFSTENFRHTVSHCQVTKYVASITASGKKIAAVYFPPSLSFESLSPIVQELYGYFLVVGDVNATFGRLYGQEIKWPTWRANLFEEMCCHGNLVHIKPAGQIPKNDHVFAKAETLASFSAEQAPIKSDHPLLLVELSIEAMVYENFGDQKRFHLRKLDKPEVSSLLCDLFKSASPLLVALFNKGKAECKEMTIETKQALCDFFDQQLVEVITDCCTKSLGYYYPSRARQTPDSLQGTTQVTSYETAALLYKRSQKNLRNLPLSSRFPSSRSPQEDAFLYFEELFKQPFQDLKVQLEDYEDILGQSSEEVLFYFSESVIQSQMENYPKTVACGEDSIHVKILLSLIPANIVGVLNCLFQFFVLGGVTPKRWNHSLVYPKPKSSESQTIDKCRPIALTSMMRRLFEKCFLSAICSHSSLSSLQKFCPTQAGFRRGFSSISQAIYAHEMATRFKLHHVFLDLKSAYDTVPLQKLFDSLVRRGVSPGALSLLIHLFHECKSSIVVNGFKTMTINKERGLMQGSVLSPLLFNLFIDDLAVLLDSRFPLFNSVCHSAIFFADDIKLQHYDVIELQQLLNCLGVWLSQQGMSVNVSKCGAFSHPSLSLSTFFIDNLVIPSVSEYSYLGFPFSFTGILFGRLCEEGCAKIESQLRYLYRFGASWPAPVRRNIYKTLLLPSLNYQLPLVYFSHGLEDGLSSQAANPRLGSMHQSAMEWIIGISRQSHVGSSIVGIPHPLDYARQLGIQFFQHYEKLDGANPLLLFKSESARGFKAGGSLLNKFNVKARIGKLPLVDVQGLSSADTLSRRLFLLHLHKYSSPTTAGYILPKARVGGYVAGQIQPTADNVLFFDDSTLLKLALSWRCNTLMFQYQCCCGERFGRNHIQQCNLLSGYPDDLAVHNEMLEDEKQQFPKLQGSSYSVLDSLLNNGKGEVFMKVLKHILRQLKTYNTDGLPAAHMVLFEGMEITKVARPCKNARNYSEVDNEEEFYDEPVDE